METNPEDDRQPRNLPSDEGEAEAKLLDAIQELDANEISETGLSNYDVLMGLEELHPGFIELVRKQIPEASLEIVGSQLSDAMKEVATELGKEKLAELAAIREVSESGLPNLKFLIKLEEFYPKFNELVFVRMQEIQQEAKQQADQSELDSSKEPVRRKFGETVIGIFKSKP